MWSPRAEEFDLENILVQAGQAAWRHLGSAWDVLPLLEGMEHCRTTIVPYFNWEKTWFCAREVMFARVWVLLRDYRDGSISVVLQQELNCKLPNELIIMVISFAVDGRTIPDIPARRRSWIAKRVKWIGRMGDTLELMWRWNAGRCCSSMDIGRGMIGNSRIEIIATGSNFKANNGFRRIF